MSNEMNIEQYITYIEDYLKLITKHDLEGKSVPSFEYNNLLANKDYLFKRVLPIFSIMKFLVFKEKFIIKVDNEGSSKLIFDYSLNEDLIPYMKLFVEHTDSTITRGTKLDVEIKRFKQKSKFNITEEELKELIWKFNKIRDSFAHNKFSIDYENQCYVIHNVAKSKNGNPPAFSVIAKIPFYLLDNEIYFYAKQNDINNEESFKKYLNFSKNIKRKFETTKFDLNLDEIIRVMKSRWNYGRMRGKLDGNFLSLDDKINYFRTLMPDAKERYIKIGENVNKDNEILTNKRGEEDRLDDIYKQCVLANELFQDIDSSTIENHKLLATLAYTSLTANLFQTTLNPKDLTSLPYYANLKFDHINSLSIDKFCLPRIFKRLEKIVKENALPYFQKPEKLNSKQEETFRDKVYEQLEYVAKGFSERSRLIFRTIRNSIDHSNIFIRGDKIFFYDYPNPLNYEDKKLCSASIDDLLLQMYELNILRSTYLDYINSFGNNSSSVPLVPSTVIELLRNLKLIGASDELIRSKDLLCSYFIDVKDHLELYDSKIKVDEFQESLSTQIKK